MKLESNFRFIERDNDGNIIFNETDLNKVAKHFNIKKSYIYAWSKSKSLPPNVEIINRGREVVYLVCTRDRYELPMFVGSAEEVAEFLDTTVNSVRSTYSHQKGIIRGNRHTGIIKRTVIFMSDPYEE